MSDIVLITKTKLTVSFSCTLICRFLGLQTSNFVILPVRNGIQHSYQLPGRLVGLVVIQSLAPFDDMPILETHSESDSESDSDIPILESDSENDSESVN